MSSATETEFAQDAGASVLDPKITHRHWQDHGRNSSSNSLQGCSGSDVRPDIMAPQALPSVPKSKCQHRPPFSRVDSVEENSLYDVPLSDDGCEHNIEPGRKKRKVTHNTVVAEKMSPAYDEGSLERHIATEAQKDEEQMRHSPSNTPAMNNSNSRRGPGKSQAGVGSATNKGMSETLRATPSINLELDSNPTVNTGIHTKGHLDARKQSKRLVRAKITPHTAHKTKRDQTKPSARPTTPDMALEQPCSQEATNYPRTPFSSTKSVCQPMTPPRPSSATGGATTPRQRELWGRLLVDNVRTRSPSSLDLPGLILAEKRPKGLYEHAESRQTSWEPRQQSAALKTRPRKIVETLQQLDQDQDGDRDHFFDDMDEMRGSSSSDNKSEYMRSEVSAADGAITVQTSPSADSQGMVNQSQDRSSNPSQAMPSLHGGGLKITYARQRSYLTDNDLGEAAMIGLPVPPEPKNRRASGRRGLGNRVTKLQSMQSLDEESGDLVDSQVGTMRSIHELREAGGNVRLVSELEAILEDLGDHQPGSTSVRRSRLIDLVTKLEEPANCRLFVDRGLESRLVADVGLGDDLIINGLLVAALLQLMTRSPSTILLAQVGDARVVRYLIDLLGCDQDILSYARLRRNNMPKAAQTDLNNLGSALMKSTAWRARKPSVLSCHVLSLQCLEYLVRQTREAGSLSEVLSAHAIRRVVATSVPRFSTLSPKPGEISLICLELAISILESCTIGNAAECQASLWVGETLERVIGLLPLLDMWQGADCGTSRTLTLRLYLNLTNNSPGLCEDFSTPEVISVMFRIVVLRFEQLADSMLEIDKALLLDDLILSLGFLINLADLSKIARQFVMDLHYGNQSYLDTLLQLFMSKSKSAAEVRIFFRCDRFSGTDLNTLGFLLGRD